MEKIKKYSIRDLAEGRCSLKNVGKVDDLQLVLDIAFPKDKKKVSDWNTHMADMEVIKFQKSNEREWVQIYKNTDYTPELPMQSCSVFLEEIEKGIDWTVKPECENSLGLNEEPKLIRRFKSGAVRGDNTGRVRPDWISPYAIEEISKVLIENANDFGACNYFLGLDETACLESMSRHVEELKEAILIKKDMVEAKIIARSVGFNAVAMLHTMVLKEKGLYKEHFDKTELVTVEEAKKSNQFINS